MGREKREGVFSLFEIAQNGRGNQTCCKYMYHKHIIININYSCMHC